jgi:hypothetical protein
LAMSLSCGGGGLPLFPSSLSLTTLNARCITDVRGFAFQLRHEGSIRSEKENDIV